MCFILVSTMTQGSHMVIFCLVGCVCVGGGGGGGGVNVVMGDSTY